MRALVVIALLFVAGQASRALADVSEIAARTGKSVVRIGVFEGEEQTGNGTGFLIRQDGIVVTNHHVADITDGYMFAVFADGTKVEVLGSLALDKEHDLALLKIAGQGYPVLDLAEPASISVGEAAILVGSTYGLDQSVGLGIVSAVRLDGFPEEIKKQAKKNKQEIVEGPLLQHTVTAAGGASGSPVVDLDGRVIGVHHSGHHGSEVNFAAHVDALRALLAKTDLDAEPKPVGPNVARNLLISLAVFAGLALLIGLALWLPGVVQRWRRARARKQHGAALH